MVAIREILVQWPDHDVYRYLLEWEKATGHNVQTMTAEPEESSQDDFRYSFPKPRGAILAIQGLRNSHTTRIEIKECLASAFGPSFSKFVFQSTVLFHDKVRNIRSGH